MLKKIFIILFFIAVAALQTALSPRIAIFGVKPDFLLIVVVVWGITRGGREGGIVGLGAGFLEDILSANFYIHTLTKAIAGFFSSVIKRNFGMASGLVYIISVGIMTPISYILEIVAFYFFFGRQLPGAYSLFSVIILSTIYNAVLTAVLFSPLVRISAGLSVDGRDTLKEYKLYRI